MPGYHRTSWQSSFIAESNPVLNHPLASSRPQTTLKTRILATIPKTVPKVDDFVDPLGVHDTPTPQIDEKKSVGTEKNGFTDGSLSNTLLDTSTIDQNDQDREFIGFKPWKEYRRLIKENFHSKDLLTLETSFLKTSITKHAQRRTNELSSSIGVLHDLTEEEYQRRFGDLTRVLHQLWKEEHRLDCLKLCREVAAALSSSQSPRFYPQKFVLVTDFLETFGQLVFERLKTKANEERAENGLDPLPSKFGTTDILGKTRITARNWFGKVSEIYDVIQRIYIGAALMPSLVFMDESSMDVNLMQLCVLACSLQHPLTSSYARCYICRISMRVRPENRGPHWKSLNDWCQSFQQQPVILLWPALEYIIQCVAYGAVTYDDLLPLWEYCKIPEKRPFMLKSVFNALPCFYLAEHSMAACKLLTSSEHINYKEVCAFGESLLNSSTVFEQNRRSILKAVWKVIKAMPSLKSFLACCEVWIEFSARYFSVAHVHFMIETVVERLTPDRKFEQHLDVLVSMIKRVVRSIRNVADFIDPDVFPRLFQLFTDKESACQMSTVVLQGLVAKHRPVSLTDTSLGYQVIDMCKCLHDVTSIHSSSDKIAEITHLICCALDRFELKSVPEQALSFLVSARGALLSLDECQRYVVGRMLEVGLYVVRSSRFSSARSGFVQACLANAFITIPSLSDPGVRIRMFIQSAELALSSIAFLQVDSFVEACLNEFRVFPANRQHNLSTIVSEFLAFLLTVPIFEEGRSSLTSYEILFEECVQRYEWNSTGAEYADVLFSCLRFLYTLRYSSLKPVTDRQFMWSVNQSALDIEPSLTRLFERISTSIQQESDRRPLISVGFLENLANFGGQIDALARPTTKIAYKSCKNAEQAIVDRMTSINFDNSGGR